MARYLPHDSYYRKARARGLPSRAAFKLEELLARFRLAPPGSRVVDLGCAPGGWLSVLARAVGPKGRAVGVDLAFCPNPPAGAVTLIGDIRDAAVRARVGAELGAMADLVTSDLAPKLSGIPERDEARLLELAASALDFAQAALKPGGAMVVKLFMGERFGEVVARFKAHFESAEVTRTRATRPGSSELYLVARGFRAAPGRGVPCDVRDAGAKAHRPAAGGKGRRPEAES